MEALDGVPPPPGYADPTLVVWREYGRWSDRLTLRAGVLVLYLAVIGVLTLVEPRERLPSTFAIVQDSIVLAIGLLQGWLMSNPRTYYAAGQSWLLSWTKGLFGGAKTEPMRASRALRFADLRTIKLRTTRGGWSRRPMRLLQVEDVHGTGWALDLTALQSCPPIVALLDGAFDQPGVTVGDGVREALHEHPRRGAPAGRTVVRVGSGSGASFGGPQRAVP